MWDYGLMTVLHGSEGNIKRKKSSDHMEVMLMDFYENQQLKKTD